MRSAGRSAGVLGVLGVAAAMAAALSGCQSTQNLLFHSKPFAERPGYEAPEAKFVSPKVSPEPARPVDAAQLFTGAWREVARNRMPLVAGCIAGVTQFSRDAQGVLIERDSCRMDSLTGKEKVIAGPVVILDTATNAKFHVAYRFGLIPIGRTYYVLDHGDDYSWFIMVTKNFKDISIFTRKPQVTYPEMQRLVGRARDFGYDVSRLEYPLQPGG